MAQKNLLENLQQTVAMTSEAARLHLLLGQHSSSEAVEAALRWRYGIDGYPADEIYKAALLLLDRMPKGR